MTITPYMLVNLVKSIVISCLTIGESAQSLIYNYNMNIINNNNKNVVIFLFRSISKQFR